MNLVEIEDYVDILSGYAFDSKLFNSDGNGIPLIRIRDVGKNESNTFYPGEYSDKYLIESGDYLIGMDGDFRIAEWKGENAILNQRVCKIVSKNSNVLDNNYLLYSLPKKLKEIEDSTSFATVKHLSVKKINKIEIPLPPLKTQQKIAAILDEADKLRQLDKKLIQKYEALSQSLFLEMFGDPSKNPNKYPKKTCGEFISYLADIGSNGANKVVSEKLVMTDHEDYAVMIRTTNLTKNNFSNKLKYVSEEVYNFFKKSQIFGGEIIMNKIGSAGDFWIMPHLNRPVSLGLNQFVIRLKEINLLYFYYFLSTDYGTLNIKSRINGVATKSITKTAVRELPILFPPISLQNQFAERIQVIEKQKIQAQQALQQSENLFNSLLQKAFKGELV